MSERVGSTTFLDDTLKEMSIKKKKGINNIGIRPKNPSLVPTPCSSYIAIRSYRRKNYKKPNIEEKIE